VETNLQEYACTVNWAFLVVCDLIARRGMLSHLLEVILQPMLDGQIFLGG
jgi:hypothetical protein